MKMKPEPVHEPFSAAEIVRDLDAVRAWGADYWSSYDVGEFFAPLGEAWPPADNVRHLVRSNRPVARALTIPRIILRIRFGVARRPSRSYSALRADYREALGGGLQAGSFAPAPLAPDRCTAEEREAILVHWSTSLIDLAAVTARWPEAELDRIRLPHPGLGLLTVREMLCFTVYHNVHHALGAERRRTAR